jgi:hypothetical protein
MYLAVEKHKIIVKYLQFINTFFFRTILEHVAELAFPPRVGVNGFEPNTVEEWLNALRLDEYLDLFHQRGYDTMDRIKQMWELELESVSCALLYAAICQWLYVSGLPRPQALIKKISCVSLY